MHKLYNDATFDADYSKTINKIQKCTLAVLPEPVGHCRFARLQKPLPWKVLGPFSIVGQVVGQDKYIFLKTF